MNEAQLRFAHHIGLPFARDGVRALFGYPLEELASLQLPNRAPANALDRFHTTFRKNFTGENKPFGFQIQDVRFGTMRARLLYV